MSKHGEFVRQQLANQWRWVRKCGRNLDGYIQNYGHGADPEPIRFGDGGELIFKADMETLCRKYNDACHSAKYLGCKRPRLAPMV